MNRAVEALRAGLVAGLVLALAALAAWGMAEIVEVLP